MRERKQGMKTDAKQRCELTDTHGDDSADEGELDFVVGHTAYL